MKRGLKAEAVLYAGIFLLLLPVCKGPTQTTPDATGTLTTTYQLSASQDSIVDVDGSRVVWLEDITGKYIKTLSVTEWVTDLGWTDQYKLRTVPDWNMKADWGNAPKEEVDAVTIATPAAVGLDTVITQVGSLRIKPGTYYCCVEINVTYIYNIMLKALIKIGGGEDQATGTIPIYTPSKHPTAGDILTNLQVKYAP